MSTLGSRGIDFRPIDRFVLGNLPRRPRGRHCRRTVSLSPTAPRSALLVAVSALNDHHICRVRDTINCEIRRLDHRARSAHDRHLSAASAPVSE